MLTDILNLTILEIILILIIIVLMIIIYRLYRTANYDFLTDIGNRLKCIKDVGKKRSSGFGVYIDVDDLKNINDTYGHWAGDKMLAATANHLRTLISNKGNVYRIGGDEFFVFLDVPDESQAKDILDEILSPLIIKIDGQNYQVSYSVGGCFFYKFINSVEELFDIADTAQYQIKKNGKNGFKLMNKEEVIKHIENLKSKS